MRETQESSNPLRPRKSESCDGGLKGIEEEKLEKDKKEKEKNEEEQKREEDKKEEKEA